MSKLDLRKTSPNPDAANAWRESVLSERGEPVGSSKEEKQIMGGSGKSGAVGILGKSSKFKEYLPGGIDAKLNVLGNVATFEVSADIIQDVVRELYGPKGLSLKLIDATDDRKHEGCFKVWYVFGVPTENLYIVPFIRVSGAQQYPSVTEITQAAGNYERKIHSFFGLEAIGNPDQRPLVLHENWPSGVYPLRKDFALSTRPKTAKGEYKFQRVDGDGIYEIPVGPIHAGIIEPGHFRFSMAGESMMLLEPRLGYVHKGTEKLFENLPLDQQIKLSEKISGDSSFSHSLAFCQAVEQLAGMHVPARAKYLRTIYAELERLANHMGDIGAIMLDTGFNFGGAHGSRLREKVIRINQQLTDSRFLRGVNIVGGVTKDIDAKVAAAANEQMSELLKDFEDVITIADGSATLLNRLKGTGPLPPEIASDYGALGVAAKAVGIANDARVHHTYAAYDDVPLKKIAVEQTGDVNARFHVRIQEVRSSIDVLHRALRKLPDGGIATGANKTPEFATSSIAIGCVEGWRGEIVHVVMTDADGKINRVMVRDPSFINWQVVGYCGQGQIIPDFPLINKSFNLSYTGHDL